MAPADVESGLACSCTCPGCGTALIAKQGKIAWHFAHHNAVAALSCVESAIHAAAKQILLDAKELRVPEKWIAVSGQTKSGDTHTIRKTIKAARKIRFDFCQEEVWEINLRPDVVGYRGTRRLLVEMFFTHRVDQTKLQKLAELGQPSIEIDLSHLPSDTDFEAIRQCVLFDTTQKEWLVYPNEDNEKVALLITLEQEIAELDLAYDRQLVEKQKKEIQQRRTAAIEEDRRQRAESIRQEGKKYQAIPLVEKERCLRESLGITGAWPYYLNRASQQATAIEQPPRIWQAGIFAAFVFGKKSVQQKIELETIFDWVIVHFGVTDSRSTEARAAVKQFLGYLRGCGFLENSPYNPYEADYYKVVHDELVPLGKPKKTEYKHKEASLPPIIVPYSWSANSQTRDKLFEIASILLKESPYRDLLLNEVLAFSNLSRASSPAVFVQKLELRGVPAETTLTFLIRLGLVFKN